VSEERRELPGRMFRKAHRSLVTLNPGGVFRAWRYREKFYIKVAKFPSSSFLLTTKPVFSDPGVSFGGLSGRLLSSSTFMEPSDYCDVNYPVDRRLRTMWPWDSI
jgi:hypothetical protein